MKPGATTPGSLTAIMRDQDRSLRGSVVRAALLALTPGYAAAVAARNALFDMGLRQPVRLPRPVISVGNLTTGGTGKTPMVIELVRRLSEMGQNPGVLLRGYRGRPTTSAAGQEENPGAERRGPISSDEQQLYLQALGPDAAVVANPNRVAGAKQLLARWPKTSIFLLDDGFQHRQVHRDLDLVLIDATDPFGHNHLLPRGFLREPPRNLRRADGVIVTRADQVTPQTLADLDAQIAGCQGVHGGEIRGHAAHQWTGWLDEAGRALPLDLLQGKRVMGVCGIGNPLAFGAMLRAAVGREVEIIALPDHYEYQPGEVDRLVKQAETGGYEALVTTEKDWVKWPPRPRTPPPPDERHIAGVNVYRPVLAIEFLDGAAAIDAALRRVVGEKA